MASKAAAKLPEIVGEYANMWPREVFDYKVTGKSRKPRNVASTLDLLRRPGVYILYRNDVPYYVGQADKLNSRLYSHARRPGSKYDLFWNYFSVFVVENPKNRNQIEALLIAAFPTANGAKPKLQRHPYPPVVRAVMRYKRSGKTLEVTKDDDGTEE
jgi:hypothetical protein